MNYANYYECIESSLPIVSNFTQNTINSMRGKIFRVVIASYYCVFSYMQIETQK